MVILKPGKEPIFNCGAFWAVGAFSVFLSFSSLSWEPPCLPQGAHPSGEPVVPEGSTLRASHSQAIGWAQDPAEPIRTLPWRQKRAGLLRGAGTA